MAISGGTTANGMHTVDCLADDVTLFRAPIFHIGGLNVTTLAAFQKGALVVLHRASTPAARWPTSPRIRSRPCSACRRCSCSWRSIPSFADTDLSSRPPSASSAARRAPLPVLKTYLARGVSMQQGYGLTETSPMVSFLAPEYALTKVGSSGTDADVRRGEARRFRRPRRSRRPARRARSWCAGRT